jgi:hypothetical protein
MSLETGKATGGKLPKAHACPSCHRYIKITCIPKYCICSCVCILVRTSSYICVFVRFLFVFRLRCIRYCLNYRLNMDLDLQSFSGLHVHSYPIG